MAGRDHQTNIFRNDKKESHASLRQLLPKVFLVPKRVLRSNAGAWRAFGFSLAWRSHPTSMFEVFALQLTVVPKIRVYFDNDHFIDRAEAS